MPTISILSLTNFFRRLACSLPGTTKGFSYERQ
jgi:hypothetical protein